MCFSTVYKDVALLSYPCIVSLGKHSYLWFSIHNVCFLAAIKIFALLLILSNLVLRYFNVVFFMFLVVGIRWASWIYGFIVFEKIGVSLAIISPNHFSARPHTLPLGDTDYMYMRKPEAVSLIYFLLFYNLLYCFISVSVSQVH